MFKSQLKRKLFGFLGTLLITFSSMGGTTPALVDFVHPEAKVTDAQFGKLLENLSPEQRKNLYKVLTASDDIQDKDISAAELEKKLLQVSHNLFTLWFAKQVNYHKTVREIAEELGVHKAECEAGSTFQLERRITEKIFAQVWEKLTPEQKQQLVAESGLSSRDEFVTWMATGAILGVLISGITWPMIFTVVCTTIGPVGWVVALPFVGYGIYKLADADTMKTAYFITLLHSFKTAALTDSGADASQYLLPPAVNAN